MAPSQIPFEIVVDPSAWEEVAPVAVPLIIVCLIVCGLGIFPVAVHLAERDRLAVAASLIGMPILCEILKS